jgi:hypothetical protein
VFYILFHNWFLSLLFVLIVVLFIKSPSSFLANSCELHETVLANKKHLLTLHVLLILFFHDIIFFIACFLNINLKVFEAIQQAQVKFIISEVSNHLENFNIHFSLQLLCDYSGFNESSEVYYYYHFYYYDHYIF